MEEFKKKIPYKDDAIEDKTGLFSAGYKLVCCK